METKFISVLKVLPAGTAHGVDSRYRSQRWHQFISALRRPSVRPGLILIIALLVGLICWVDLDTGPGREPAALYDIPILLSAVALGTTGALASAAAASLFYHLTLWYHSVAYSIADFSQTMLFFLLGVVVAQLVAEHRRALALQTELLRLNEQLEHRVAAAVAAEREAQQKLRETQSLTMMGEAAAQIAHEIKNPLAAIGGFARAIQKQIPNDHPARSGLSIIAEEVIKLETFLRDLLDFARPVCSPRYPIEVTALVNEVLAFVQQPAQQHGVQVENMLPEQSLTVMGDGDKLKRALLNVVLNGIQAMRDGGKLTISVLSEYNNGVPGMRLTVRDTGSGIPPQNLSRIFDPFFTTKHGGTGLGLALVKKTVEAHGGLVQVDSVPEIGTSVMMWLPFNITIQAT